MQLKHFCFANNMFIHTAFYNNKEFSPVGDIQQLFELYLSVSI